MNQEPSTDWKSIVEDLVSAHRLFERESKIIVSKLLLERFEIKTQCQENINQNQEFQDKIGLLQKKIASAVEKNKFFEKQEESIRDRIYTLQEENLELREYRNQQRPMTDALEKNDHYNRILSSIQAVVDSYRNNSADNLTHTKNENDHNSYSTLCDMVQKLLYNSDTQIESLKRDNDVKSKIIEHNIKEIEKLDSSLKFENDQRQDQIVDFIQKIKDLKDERELDAKVIQDLNRSNANVFTLHAEYLQKENDLQEQLRLASDRAKFAEEKIQKMRDEFEATNSTASTMHAEYLQKENELQEQLRLVSDRAKSAEEKIQKMRDEFEATNLTASTMHAEYLQKENELQEQLRLASDRAKFAEEKIQKMRDESEANNASGSQIPTDYLQKENDLQEQLRLESERAKSAEDEIQKMREEFEKKERDVLRELSEINQLANKYRRAFTPNESITTESGKTSILGFLSSITSRKSNHSSSTKKELEEILVQASMRINLMEKELSDQINAVKKDQENLKKLESIIINKDTKINELTTELLALKKKVESLDGDIVSNLRSSITEGNTAADIKKIKILEDELKNASNQLKVIKEENEKILHEKSLKEKDSNDQIKFMRNSLATYRKKNLDALKKIQDRSDMAGRTTIFGFLSVMTQKTADECDLSKLKNDLEEILSNSTLFIAELQKSLKENENTLEEHKKTIQRLNEDIEGYSLIIRNITNEKQSILEKSEVLQALILKFEQETASSNLRTKSAEMALQDYIQNSATPLNLQNKELETKLLLQEKQINQLNELILEYETIIDDHKTEEAPLVEREDYERQLDELLDRALNAEEELEKNKNLVLNLEKVRNQQPNMTSTTDMDQYLEEIDRLKNQMTCQLSEKRCLMEQLDRMEQVYGYVLEENKKTQEQSTNTMKKLSIKHSQNRQDSYLQYETEISILSSEKDILEVEYNKLKVEYETAINKQNKSISASLASKVIDSKLEQSLLHDIDCLKVEFSSDVMQPNEVIKNSQKYIRNLKDKLAQETYRVLELEEIIINLKEKMKKLEESYCEKKENLDQKIVCLSDIDTKRSNLEKELQVNKEILEKTQPDLLALGNKTQIISELELKVENLNYTCLNLEKESQLLSDSLNEAERTNQTNEKLLQEKEICISKLNLEIRSLKKEIDAQQLKIEHATHAGINDGYELKLQSLISQMAKIEEELTFKMNESNKMGEELEASMLTINCLNNEKKCILEQFATLETKYNKAITKSQRDRPRVSDLERKCEDHQKNISDFATENIIVTTENSYLLEQLKDLKDLLLENSKTENRESGQVNYNLREEVNEWRRKFENLSLKLVTLEEKNIQLQVDITNLENDLLEADKRILKENTELADKIQIAEAMHNLTMNENLKLKSDLEYMSLKKEDVPNASKTSSQQKGIIVISEGVNGKKIIQSGHLKELIERLFDPKEFDLDYLRAFIMTHTIFMGSMNLMDTFINQFSKYVQEPSDNSKLITLRIINILKYWTENFFEDFETQEALLQRLNCFLLDNSQKPGYESIFTMLIGNIKRKLTKENNQTKLNLINAPRPIYPKESLDYVFLDSDALELARQITLIDHELFCKIKPREFIGVNWLKEGKEIKAANLLTYLSWERLLVNWLVTEIVSNGNPKIQLQILEKIISIAQHMEKLNNFSGVKMVIKVIKSPAVYALKKVKDQITSKAKKTLESLEILVNPELNYKTLRNKAQEVAVPLIIPHDVYQSDLMFLDTCGPDKLSDGSINFQKFHRIMSCISQIISYQTTCYSLEPVQAIKNYIGKRKIMNEDQSVAATLKH